MTVVNLLPVLPVADFETALTWYGTVFGRGPDRRPMDGCAEWQLAATCGVQVYRMPEAAGRTSVIVGVDDVDAQAAELAARGMPVEPYDVPSGQFRLAAVQDPDGNTLTFAQER